MGYPICGICYKSCKGDTITFKQKHYHIGCFKCDKCSILLANCPFFCLNGRYLCIHDYLNLCGKRCHACQRYIEGEYVQASNRMYHKDCFVCSQCKGQLNDGCILPNRDDIICQKCQISFKNGDCWGCRKKIGDYPIITIFNYQWHSKCFKCGICQRSLSLNSYTFYNQQIYCNSDFYRFVAFKCHQCHKPIVSNHLETDNDVGSNDQGQPNVLRFHHNCVKCYKCKEPILSGQQIYCKSPNLWHIECDRQYQESLDRRSFKSSEMSELQFSTPTTGNSTNSSLSNKNLSNLTKQYSYLHHQQYLQRPLGPKSPNPLHYHIPPPTRTISTTVKEIENNYEKFQDFKTYNNKQNNDYLKDLEKLAIIANKWSNQSEKQESTVVTSDDNRGRCNDNSNNTTNNNSNSDSKCVKNGKSTMKWWRIFQRIRQFTK